jgi:hypothetical protein
MPQLRIAGNGEASVEVRHGEILHRVLAGYFRQFRLRRLLILILLRLQVNRSTKSPDLRPEPRNFVVILY